MTIHYEYSSNIYNYICIVHHTILDIIKSKDGYIMHIRVSMKNWRDAGPAV